MAFGKINKKLSEEIDCLNETQIQHSSTRKSVKTEAFENQSIGQN